MPYSWSHAPFHPSTERYENLPVCPDSENSFGHLNLLCSVDVSKQPEGTLPDIQIGAEAIRFITSQQTNQTSPFFLAVGFHKPHVPFRIPNEYLDLFPLADLPEIEYPTKPPRMPDIAWNPFRWYISLLYLRYFYIML